MCGVLVVVGSLYLWVLKLKLGLSGFQGDSFIDSACFYILFCCLVFFLLSPS